jgi:2-dehydropantoate 2-reductase
MRVAIMGSGSIGGFVGGRLASSGAEVLFIARGAHLRAMQSSGLRILSQTGDVILPRVHATDDPSGQAPADFVIFTVKGPDTRGAAELIRPLVGPSTGIVTFQNGVAGIDVLAGLYSAHAVMPGTTMTTARIEEPGTIRHVGTGNQFTVGEWNGEESERAQAFSDAATQAGLVVNISKNIHVDVWSKLVAFAAFSAITSLTRLPVRTCATLPETRALVLEAMNEVIAVAKARGIVVPSDAPARVLAFAETVDPNWKTSMCNDLEAGKVIEVDSSSGALHRLGQDLGVATPVHTFAYRALKYYASPHRAHSND